MGDASKPQINSPTLSIRSFIQHLSAIQPTQNIDHIATGYHFLILLLYYISRDIYVTFLFPFIRLLFGSLAWSSRSLLAFVNGVYSVSSWRGISSVEEIGLIPYNFPRFLLLRLLFAFPRFH